MVLDQRYARLEASPALGADGLALVRSRPVAVLGVGNIGGQLAQHLVLLGIPVVLIDRDVVSEANLGTQGFTEQQVHRPKVNVRAEWLGPLNPTCRIEPIHADIRRLGRGVLRDVALLVSCLDNRPGRLFVNELAVRLGIPLIDGALDGSGASLFGRVACYDPRAPESACYLCPHDRASLLALRNETSTGMGCSRDWWTSADELSTPTLAVSALGGAVASMLAVWGMTVLLNRAEEVAGQELYFDLGRRILSTHKLRRNPRCLLDHKSWHLTPLGGRSRRATVAETFKFAEDVLGEAVVLQLPGRAIVTTISCPQCARERHPYRILEGVHAGYTECECGMQMMPRSTDVLDRFGRSDAEAFLDRTWAELGLPPADVVVATAGGTDLPLLLAEATE